MKDEKIFEEELLSDEELENVAGGTLNEMVKDSKFLHALGLMDRAYSAKEIKDNKTGISTLINEAFGSQGMWVEAETGLKNVYGDDDYNDYTRAQAYKALADKVKPGFNYRKYL